ncbi:hypothetical protein [Bacillus sp. m3-13]|uniref:hypothetical protein n=1 Tax=Bacillus sp. m3-13 TaxID=406124 RepID=UPI00049475D7|nr:hypothetical protein [Bacillus sp. m3-13]
MVKYLITLIIVLAVEIGMLIGISTYFDFNLLSTMFFRLSCLCFSSHSLQAPQETFSQKIQKQLFFDSMAGRYNPQQQKPTLHIGPFLLGSLLCLAVYFIMAFFLS